MALCILSSQVTRWHIDLQPWAGPTQSLEEEALRFLRYISTTQVVWRVRSGYGVSLAPFKAGHASKGVKSCSETPEGPSPLEEAPMPSICLSTFS